MKRRFVRISQIATTRDREGLVPVSPATIWRWVAQGKFPKPKKIGPNTTAWDLETIEAFLANPAEKGADK